MFTGFLRVAIESWPDALFRSIRLTYQVVSSTITQSQLCTATPISSFVQCQISFRLLLYKQNEIKF